MQLDILLRAFGISKTNARAPSQVPGEENDDVKVETVYGSSRSSKLRSRKEYIKALTDFQYFTEGEFIADTDRARYHHLSGHIILTTKTIYPEHPEIRAQRPVNLVRLFSNLYNFRGAINYFSGNEFSKKKNETLPIADEYGLFIKNKFLKMMVDDVTEVDEILCLLIDPEKRTFREEDIDYPEFDLEAIDQEYYAAHPDRY